MSKHGPYRDVSKFGFITEPRYYFFGWSSESRILGRRSAINALLRAQSFLPKGYRFKVWDFQRPRHVQLAMITSFIKRLRTMHKGITPKKLHELVMSYAAAPLSDDLVVRRDCHRNGGAVDLTIVDRDGCELYMGTDHDDLTPKAASLYYEKQKKLTKLEKEARNNRRMLRKAMEKAGWEMLPSEWWHWSTLE